MSGVLGGRTAIVTGAASGIGLGIVTRLIADGAAVFAAARSKDRSVIDHPPGEETQWDWLELPDPPAQWGFTGKAHAHHAMTKLGAKTRTQAVACALRDALIA